MALSRVSKAMDYQVDAVMSNVDPTVFPSADRVVALSDFDGSTIQDNSYFVFVHKEKVMPRLCILHCPTM